MVAAQTTQSSLIDYSRCEHRSRLLSQNQNADYKADKADQSIAGKVSHALWKNNVLRSTDYGEIEVEVINRAVILSGHVNSISNQQRAIAAAQTIPGVLSVKSYLFSDDHIIREVAMVLAKIEHSYGVKFFTGAQNGVVKLNGEVGSATERSLAEKYAASIPGVRGVINSVRAPGVDLNSEDQRFLQPVIGEKIYFREGPFAILKKVIINPSNKRVIAMVVQDQSSSSEFDSRSIAYGEDQSSGRLTIIPMSNIRYLTKRAGFLHIDSKDAVLYMDFDISSFIAPSDEWTPPYPYCRDEVLFPVEAIETMDQMEPELVMTTSLSP